MSYTFSIETGLSLLDQMIGGGVNTGELMIIGGRPGMGCTSLFEQIKKHNRNSWCLDCSSFADLNQLKQVFDSVQDWRNRYIVYDNLEALKRIGPEGIFFLKETAVRCSIPIAATVKLPRSVELRQNRRPVVADFEQSFCSTETDCPVHNPVRQNADIIIGLYRPSYYYDGKAMPGEADEIIVLQNPRGMPGTIQASFCYPVWNTNP